MTMDKLSMEQFLKSGANKPTEEIKTSMERFYESVINKSPQEIILAFLDSCDTVDANGQRTEFPTSTFLLALFNFYPLLRPMAVLNNDKNVDIICKLTDKLMEFLKLKQTEKNLTLINDSLLAAFCCGMLIATPKSND